MFGLIRFNLYVFILIFFEDPCKTHLQTRLFECKVKTLNIGSLLFIRANLYIFIFFAGSVYIPEGLF